MPRASGPGKNAPADVVELPALSASTGHATASEHGNLLTNLLNTQQRGTLAAGKCRWHLSTAIGLHAQQRAAIAWIVADAIMVGRGGDSKATELWRTAALGGQTLTGTDWKVVAAFVDSVFGLPPKERSEDHLIGHVAEWLWYLHAKEIVDPMRAVLLLEPPKFTVTEPGADGFVVYRSTDTGETTFRLWEVKKHTGASAVSTTVGDAYDQLNAQATRYLAQLTSIHSAKPDQVGELCKQLVEFWVDSNDRAGVGVGVASAAVPGPVRCFSTMGRRFPGFTHAGQLEGLLLTIEDLPGVARGVRGYLWTVL